MDLSKFNLTPSAKKSLEKSQEIAEFHKHLKVIDLHLISAILSFKHSNIDYALESNGLLKEGLVKAFEHTLVHYKEPRRKKKIFAPEILEILDFAKSKATSFEDEYIGIDHILLSIFSTREEVADFLIELEVDLQKLILDLENFIQKGIPKNTIPVGVTQAPPTTTESASQQIKAWCENLNEKILARGDFEIFGREKEIERSFEILLRKNKSNIILVGEAGVGKTAIVEGMAEKIIQRQCPDLLLHKNILSLDLTSVLAGTIYRGQMEEKLKNILDTLSKDDHYILFIDEIHNIIGSGSSEGSMDMANILKPALSRGNISCIGATTKNEYEKFFKKDAALNRRFEMINISEPSKEDTLELILSAKKSYENFHQVQYSEQVLEKIVDLCDIYLSNKKFPDKAFDIIDESGARTKKVNITRPQKAKDMESKLADSEFQESKEFEDFHQKYVKIIENWGKNLAKKTFSVDIETIYGIFADKLNTSKENIKQGKSVPSSGKIGF